MGLRKKTTLIIGLTLICLIAVLYVAARIIVLGGFAQQEQADTQRNVQRVLSALQDSTEAMAGAARDWGSWDDTYSFVADHNQEYIDSNLATDITFVNNQISLVAIVDNSDQVIYAKAFDLHANQQIAVPQDLLTNHLVQGRLLPSDPDSTQVITGLISLAQAPMIIATQPILTSNGDGPRRGTVVFGRFLDAPEIQNLAETTLFALDAYQVNSPNLPEQFSAAIPAITAQAPILVQPINSNTVAGYTVIKDVYDQPALVLQVATPREVYARGQDTLLYFVLALLAAGLIFAAIVAALLNRLVLARLSQLSHSVDAVTASNALSSRVELQGNDELAGLAGNVNAMLEALETAQHERHASEERYRALVETSPYAIVLSNLEGQIIFCNQQAATLYGCAQVKDLVGRDTASIVAPEDRRKAAVYTQRTLEQGSIRNIEYTAIRDDGVLFPTELSASVLYDSDGKPMAFLSVTQDITERKQLQQKLSYQAFHDPLTGLSNRAMFMDRLTATLPAHEGSADAVGLLFLDLDDFKTINDSLGHKAGDELLVEVAARLGRSVRQSDSISRLGGDEFTILVEQPANVAVMSELSERILAQFHKPFILEDQEVVVGVSIGLALGSRATTPADLLRYADMAMYEAKRNGKGTYALFDATADSDQVDRVALAADLFHALERNELRVYYQPVVRLKTGEIHAVEATVCWQHPQRGLLAPDEFIPLAEQSGLIAPIGRWLLEQACCDVQRMQQVAAVPLMLSVNLYEKQFRAEPLLNDVKHSLEASKLDAQYLSIALRESILLATKAENSFILSELKKMGVHLAVSDFGAAYSAPGYLKKLPIDTLQLDPSCIAGLEHEERDKIFVQAVIALARTLRLNLVAEGIKTTVQAEDLLEWECEYGQGQHFAAPLPMNKMLDLVNAAHAKANDEKPTDQGNNPHQPTTNRSLLLGPA